MKLRQITITQEIYEYIKSNSPDGRTICQVGDVYDLYDVDAWTEELLFRKDNYCLKIPASLTAFDMNDVMKMFDEERRNRVQMETEKKIQREKEDFLVNYDWLGFRNQAASSAMAGVLVNNDLMLTLSERSKDANLEFPEIIAKFSVDVADALISVLKQ